MSALQYGAKSGLIPAWQAGELTAPDFQPILSAGSLEPIVTADLEPIVTGDLERIVAAAVSIYVDAGLPTALVETLGRVEFVIADLPGSHLGLAGSNTIALDTNAAGFGWFVDPTPGGNEEFQLAADGSYVAVLGGPADGRIDLLARDGGPADDRMDLLSVILHELGHIVGLDHHHELDRLMSETLEPGSRRLPTAAEIDALFETDSEFDGN